MQSNYYCPPQPSADDVRSNNICCLSKLWQLRLALLSNVALLVWCHSRYFLPLLVTENKENIKITFNAPT